MSDATETGTPVEHSSVEGSAVMHSAGKQVLSQTLAWPLERVIPWVAILPIPLWFLVTVAVAAAPAWRARYSAAESDAVIAEAFEREMSHLWSGQFAREVPGGVPEESFYARFDACLTLEDQTPIRFMLVTDGSARFFINGEERLAAKSDKERGVSGNLFELTAGMHHLQVEYTARKRPSVALLASFDGEVPAALGSGRVASGAKVSTPGSGEQPCP